LLLAMGRWLAINGEAFYGTRPWKISGEGPTKVVGGSFHDTATKPYTSRDIRFTTRDGLLYAIVLASRRMAKSESSPRRAAPSSWDRRWPAFNSSARTPS